MGEGKPDTTASRFAGNVRARRELSGMSQSELAQALVNLGHSSFRQQTIAEIEGSRRQVKLDEAMALSRALGITVDSLIRPVRLTRQASELLDAARVLEEAARQAARWLTERNAARRRLEKALTAAAGHEDELADELAVARSTLADAKDE